MSFCFDHPVRCVWSGPFFSAPCILGDHDRFTDRKSNTSILVRPEAASSCRVWAFKYGSDRLQQRPPRTEAKSTRSWAPCSLSPPSFCSYVVRRLICSAWSWRLTGTQAVRRSTSLNYASMYAREELRDERVCVDEAIYSPATSCLPRRPHALRPRRRMPGNPPISVACKRARARRLHEGSK